MYLLILGVFYKMYFDHIHPQLLTQLFTDLPSPPYPSQFYNPLILGCIFKKIICSLQCVLSIYFYMWSHKLEHGGPTRSHTFKED